MDLGMFSCEEVWVCGCLVVRRYGFGDTCFSCKEVWIWGCLVARRYGFGDVVRRYGFVECLVVRRYGFGDV